MSQSYKTTKTVLLVFCELGNHDAEEMLEEIEEDKATIKKENYEKLYDIHTMLWIDRNQLYDYLGMKGVRASVKLKSNMNLVYITEENDLY